jgi:hypothetical protein
MSGGPVYSKNGVVIGLIKGGIPGQPAINWITPIRYAIGLLQQAEWLEDCGPIPIDFCTLQGKTTPERRPGGDGKTYLVHYDFSRGKEKIEPKACGREIWTIENESDPWFGWKYAYLVDGKKRYVSQTLYVEKDDGSLEISK